MKPDNEPFSIDKHLQIGSIYVIEQNGVRKVISMGSLERMKLFGHWKVNREFKDAINESR